MRKILMVGAFALSFSLMSSLLLTQANAWIPQWEATWGGESAEIGVDVAVAPDGSIYTVGYTFTFAQGAPYYCCDAFILKYDQTGNLLWQRTWGGWQNEMTRSVAIDPTGNYIYVVGTTESFGQGDHNAFILKFDNTGNLIWDKTWGGPSVDSAAADVAVHQQGDIYVVGYTKTFEANHEAFILGFHPSGDLFLQQTWGGDGTDWATNLAIGIDGAIYVVGYTDSFIPGNFEDAFIVKFDEMGNIDGQWTWGGIGDEWAHGVAVAGGRIFAVGFTDSFGVGERDAFIFALNPNGLLIWDRTWGGTQEERAFGAVAARNCIYLVGRTESFGAGASVNSFAAKFNPGGRLVSDIAWGKNGGVVAHDVAFDPTASFLYIAGVTYAPFPPNYLTPVEGDVTTPDCPLVPVSGNVIQTTAIPGTPNGIVAAPTGSTTFAGVSDTALIKMSD